MTFDAHVAMIHRVDDVWVCEWQGNKLVLTSKEIDIHPKELCYEAADNMDISLISEIIVFHEGKPSFTFNGDTWKWL